MNFQTRLLSTLFFSAILCLPAKAMLADSIAFYKTEAWANILQMANTQQKMIFVDVYTSWCGPCKAMDKKTFKEAEVATYFNQNFINVKLDAEKGEGIELSKTYKVQSYPTYLFISGKGELLGTFGGFMKGDKFLEQTKAMLSTISGLASLEQAYLAGKREPAFLAQYATASQKAGKPFVPIFEDYWQARNTPATASKEDLELAYQLLQADRPGFMDYKSTLVQTCLKNVDTLRKMYEKSEVNDAVKSVIEENIRAYTYKKNEQSFEELLKLLTDFEKNKKAMSRSERAYRIDFYEKTEQWERFMPLVMEENKNFEKQHSLDNIARMDTMMVKMMAYMKKEGKGDVMEDMDLKEMSMKIQSIEKLTEDAMTFHDHTENPTYLQEALKWSAHALTLEANAQTLTTQAHLLSKNNKKKDARKILDKAFKQLDTEFASAKDEDDKKYLQELKDKAQTLLNTLKKK